MFGANLVIPAQVYDELLHRQAKFLTILSQNGQNDLESQGQLHLFWTVNMVIQTQICDELLHKQANFLKF